MTNYELPITYKHEMTNTCIYSVLQAPLSEGGAGIDLASLLAGGRWRLDGADPDAPDAADATDGHDGRDGRGDRGGAVPPGQLRATEQRERDTERDTERDERDTERTFQAMLTLVLTLILILT